MAWANPVALNCRATVGYVTDPANTVFLDAANTYPTSKTCGAVTTNVGYTDAVTRDGRNRSNTAGREKLAGVHFMDIGGSGIAILRINLEASGVHDIRFGIGDATFDVNGKVEIFDDTSLLATVTGNTAAADRWLDAAGTIHTSAANWYANNAARRLTFASSIAIFKFHKDGTYNTLWSHVSVEQAVLPTRRLNRLAI